MTWGLTIGFVAGVIAATVVRAVIDWLRELGDDISEIGEHGGH